jgi:hypothetical protein
MEAEHHINFPSVTVCFTECYLTSKGTFEENCRVILFATVLSSMQILSCFSSLSRFELEKINSEAVVFKF